MQALLTFILAFLPVWVSETEYSRVNVVSIHVECELLVRKLGAACVLDNSSGIYGVSSDLIMVPVLLVVLYVL